jgi:RNA polymerase sigma-70 factor (ECF subfamily)
MGDARGNGAATARTGREPFGVDGKSICISAVFFRGDLRGSVDQTGLVERASRGDHEAFGVLVGAHLARLDTAARLILRDPELAREAVQDATLRAWKNLRGLRDPGRLDAWLHRLTVNACLDIARKRRGRFFEVELTPLHDPPVPDPTSRVADALYVERMLAAVDPAQRAVVVLHFYLDLTLPETAAALGIPVGTAKSRLNRALDAMRIRVADENELPATATATERFA